MPPKEENKKVAAARPTADGVPAATAAAAPLPTAGAAGTTAAVNETAPSSMASVVDELKARNGEASSAAAGKPTDDADDATAPKEAALADEVKEEKKEKTLLETLKEWIAACKDTADYSNLAKDLKEQYGKLNSENKTADAAFAKEFAYLAQAKYFVSGLQSCVNKTSLNDNARKAVAEAHKFFHDNGAAYVNMSTPSTQEEHDAACREFDELYKAIEGKGLLAVAMPSAPMSSAAASSSSSASGSDVAESSQVKLEEGKLAESSASASAAASASADGSDKASDSDESSGEEKMSAEAEARAIPQEIRDIQSDISKLNDDIAAIQREIDALKVPAANSEDVSRFMSRRVIPFLGRIETCVSTTDGISSSILSSHANGLFGNDRKLLSGVNGLLELGNATEKRTNKSGKLEDYFVRDKGAIVEMEYTCSECIESLRTQLSSLGNAAEMLDRTQVNPTTGRAEVVELGINSKIGKQLEKLHANVAAMRKKAEGMKEFVVTTTMRDMPSVAVAKEFGAKFGVSLAGPSVRSLRWKGYVQQVRNSSDIFATRLEMLCRESKDEDRRQRGLLALEEHATTTGWGCCKKTHIEFRSSETNLGGLMSAVVASLRKMRLSYEKSRTVDQRDVESLRNRCLEFADEITLERILDVKVNAEETSVQSCMARLNYIFYAETFGAFAERIRKDVPKEKDLQVYMQGGTLCSTRVLEGMANGKATREEVGESVRYKGLTQVTSLESALDCFGVISGWSLRAVQWSKDASGAAKTAMSAKKEAMAPALSRMLGMQADSLLECVNEIAGYGALYGVLPISEMRSTLASFTGVFRSEVVADFLRRCEFGAEKFAKDETVAMGSDAGKKSLDVEVEKEAIKRFEQEQTEKSSAESEEGAAVSREERIEAIKCELEKDPAFMQKLIHDRKERFFGKVFQDKKDNTYLTPEVRRSVRSLFHNVTVGLRFAQRLDRMNAMVGRDCNFGTIASYYRGIISLIVQYQSQGQIIVDALRVLQQSNGITTGNVSTLQSALDGELKIIQGKGSSGLKQQLENFATTLHTWLGEESKAVVRVINEVSTALAQEEAAVQEAAEKVKAFLGGTGEVSQIAECVHEGDTLQNEGNVADAMSRRTAAIGIFNSSFVLSADVAASSEGTGGAVMREEEEDVQADGPRS